jgi:hypothetical protein
MGPQEATKLAEGLRSVADQLNNVAGAVAPSVTAPPGTPNNLTEAMASIAEALHGIAEHTHGFDVDHTQLSSSIDKLADSVERSIGDLALAIRESRS